MNAKLGAADYAMLAIALALLVTVAVRAGIVTTDAPPPPGGDA